MNVLPKNFLIALPSEIEELIKELEERLKIYGSFNILANIILNNQYHIVTQTQKSKEASSPVIQEYLALVLLKYPFSLGFGEYSQPQEVANDFIKINELAYLIIGKHAALHYHNYNVIKDDGSTSDLDQIAQAISTEELLVRNPTFESFHWDVLEGLY